MRKLLFGYSLIAAMLLCTTGASAQGGKMYVKVNKENIRRTPNGQKTGELTSGSEVEVLERRDNWVKVQYTGWIWSASLDADPTRVEGYQIHLSHILVKTEAEAGKILTDLSSGITFETLAKQQSLDKVSAVKGGDLGLFSRGDMSAAMADFETEAFKLKSGAVSGIVKSQMGYHIIKRVN